MQPYRLPPLPNQNIYSTSKLLKIMKINPQNPTSHTLAMTRKNSLEVHSLSLSKDQSSSQQQRSRSERNGSIDRVKIRPESSKQAKVQVKNQLFSDGSAYLKLPKITAKSWILFEMKQQRCLYGLRHFKRRQIASLTKMLNLITIINLVQSLGLNPKKIAARASQRSTSINGTTAQLKPSHLYNLQDLYYGMMLPSGNDAATMIAQIGGSLLKIKQSKDPDWSKVYNQQYLTQMIKKDGSLAIGSYLREMNQFGRIVGMNNTNVVNVHGLSNTASYSTAMDLAKLCTFSMGNQQFRKIVNTKKYTYYTQPSPTNDQTQDKQNIHPNITQEPTHYLDYQKVQNYWQNTNRMLGQGWSGIKTGITPNAGPCLAASCQRIIKGRRYQFLIILLKSQSLEARWNQVRELLRWAEQSHLNDTM